ncbi:hypothetical protein FOA52_012595 [Chlamydomonas sp. UWO 241]|nr:hypothetical protein FOA52_012595 [Chlamydomonas sp. UWO 241]
MAEGVKIDVDTFCKRIKKLHEHWQVKREAAWAGANSLSIVVGASSEDLRYLKSISLQLWLFGYELPDTVMVLTKTELHVLTSAKKAVLLQPLSDRCLADTGLKFTVLVKPKAEDGSTQMRQLLDAVRAADESPAVGVLPKDKHTGKVSELFESLLAESQLPTVDCSAGLADLLATKDPSEVLNVKKAAMLASKVMKDFVVPQIEAIVDGDKKVKHSKLSTLTEGAITDPSTHSKLSTLTEGAITDPSTVSVKLRAENVDIAYPPIFQSGGKYDLKVSVPSDDSPLHDGVIVVSLGCRYASYCANISRTYIINPTKKQEDEYGALLAAHEAVMAGLVDGAAIAGVVDKAVEVLKSKGQDHLVERLTKNLGFGMGLEFRESGNMLSGKNEGVARAGMVFNVCIGVQNLENDASKDARGRVYAFQIADTVVVPIVGKEPEIATAGCPRSWQKVSYTLKDDEDGGEDGDGDVKLEDMTNGGVPSRKTLRSDDPTYKSAEQVRKEKQEALLRQKNEETLRRLTATKEEGGNASTAGRVVLDIVAYKGLADLPLMKDLLITVDQKAESVLLPIYGVMVPFHITTIKNVTSNQDHDHAYVRVTFNLGNSYDPYVKFPNSIFLKELSFRSSDQRHATSTVTQIKQLRSSVTQRDKERAERSNLVAQERLVPGKKVFKLPDLWIRPTFGGKGRKLPGTLEAHANGFRYSTPKNETINVMYRNIRHAFFQPAENEMVTILHFHLINPIMLGNKKTKDVQFYTEVMEVVQTLDGGRRNAYDPDEIEEEQRERERRNKINHEFSQFVKRVQEVWEKDYHDLGLEFDIPFRELGFNGTPHRSAVFIMPTVNCLIELTEMPFLVLSISDIEIVNLERVGFNLKNFDLALVLKDFSKDVVRVDAVPSKSLETIKDWLTSVKIKYYESKMNLAWKPILKSIIEDPDGFIEQGGWEFLNMDKSDSDDEDGEEQSADYAPSGSAEEEEEDEDDSDSDGSVVDSDDDDDGDASDEEEGEEGLTWDELEEEAREDDKAREDEGDSEGEQRKKKRGGGGGGGGGGGSSGAAKRSGGGGSGRAPAPAAKRQQR